jgi:hypothetical protein
MTAHANPSPVVIWEASGLAGVFSKIKAEAEEIRAAGKDGGQAPSPGSAGGRGVRGTPTTR